MPLVAMRFHGAYPRVPGHWQRFASQLRDLGFDLSAAQAVGILYDDPAFTPEHRIRYDCCVVDPGFPAHRLRGALRHEIMRPGEYAQLDVAGAYPVVAEGMFSIASLWLPQARRTPAASPAYEIHRRPPWNDQGLFEVTVLMALR
ncbi:GyrI-like domain-containing protein [Chelatococcus albus]|uniref:GyrI-like domain-containing protein n=1 Tax=Chelatococcus albus TaxID=3047466 RepID=UPI0024BC5CEA|nr:GyrI-like domain-containing protein [Chelatococcus sp. SYSU_G07232]